MDKDGFVVVPCLEVVYLEVSALYDYVSGAQTPAFAAVVDIGRKRPCDHLESVLFALYIS